jgi:Tfp pilus assembly protein PilF
MARINIFILLSLLMACDHSQTTEKQQLKLGEVHLSNSGSEEAQPYFEKGLLLLHSFEYEDARASFVKAQETDPDFAMAYWGEAMTFNQPIWHRQQYEDGQAALNKYGDSRASRLEKIELELEKSLWQSAEILFGEGTKAARDSAYAQYMGQLKKSYPDNEEVAALYALSLLGAVQEGRDEQVFGKSAVIAQGILEENPNHPGALHYLIHSYDDPQHAHLALQAANSYAKVAPDAAHALHMPSHIYVAMGMWEEVVSSNIASYEASVKRMENKGLDHDARSYHAYHWLMYGHLQLGNKEEARRILLQMNEYTNELPSEGARAYLIRMKGNYLVETGDWKDEQVSSIQPETEGLNIGLQAIQYFLGGMLAYQNEQEDILEELVDSLYHKIQLAGMNASNEGAPMCSSGSGYGKATRVDVGKAKVMEQQLRALLANLQGEEEIAEKSMQTAVELQDGLDYNYGPPEIVYPSYEFYGEWLLDKGRKGAAKEMFERALERGPGRLKAVEGMRNSEKKEI